MELDSMEAPITTEEDLRISIEEWRRGNIVEAKRVMAYLYAKFYPKIVTWISYRMSPVWDMTNNGEDQDEDGEDSDGMENGPAAKPGRDGYKPQDQGEDKVRKGDKSSSRHSNTQHHDRNDGKDQDEDGEDWDGMEMGNGNGPAVKPGRHGYKPQEQGEEKVRNGDKTGSRHSNSQYHDRAAKTFEEAVEEVALTLRCKCFVTMNEDSETGCETYTGHYSGRSKLKRREDFVWKGEPSFGSFFMTICKMRIYDSFNNGDDQQPPRRAEPHLKAGDIPDPQHFQKVVYSQERRIDEFLEKQLAVCRKGKEWLSDTALRDVLNRVIDGESLCHMEELGGVDFTGLKLGTTPGTTWEKERGILFNEDGEDTGVKCGTTLNLLAERARKRANRELLEAAYEELINPMMESAATQKLVYFNNVEDCESMEKALPIMGHKISREYDGETKKPDYYIEKQQVDKELTVVKKMKFRYVMFQLSEVMEKAKGIPIRRLVEGLIVYLKWKLWNTTPRPALVWTSEITVPEVRTCLDKIQRIPTEQLLEEADLVEFRDDLPTSRARLSVEVGDFLLHYLTLDLPKSDRSSKKTLRNTYVSKPKSRLKDQLKHIVPWFYEERS
ncbi:MAG: hypothetical protein U0236_22400 [Nitrospira sp.]